MNESVQNTHKYVDTFDLWICIEKKFHLFQFEIEKPNESVLHGQSTAWKPFFIFYFKTDPPLVLMWVIYFLFLQNNNSIDETRGPTVKVDFDKAMGSNPIIV